MKKIPSSVKKFYPEAVFELPTRDQSIYLTFDDGPQEGSTPEVLKILKAFEVKATFFCLGKNVEDNPDLFQKIMEEGHRVGNHTYSHLNGWCSSTSKYLQDVAQANQIFNSEIFRPPYGRLRINQFKKLKKYFKIIFWSSMPGDYSNISSQNILRNLKDGSKNGAIIVLHDHTKNIENMKDYLNEYLKWALDKGYSFKLL